MKRVMSIAIAGVAVFALSGCGEGGTVEEQTVTNSIYMEKSKNHQGNDQKIYYHCYHGSTNGTITFMYPDFKREKNDICDFDLHGRAEEAPDSNQIGIHYVEGRIYLTDESDTPWDGQDYSCEKPYGQDTVRYTTGPNGYIDQASNYYRCTIYFRD